MQRNRGIAFPPEEPWKEKEYASAFLAFLENEAEGAGWTVLSRGVSERSVSGAGGLEFKLTLGRGGKKENLFCFLGGCGGSVFCLEGRGGGGFPPVWDRILREASVEGVEIMPPFFWGLFLSLGFFLVMTGFRYDKFRKDRKKFSMDLR